MIKILFTVAIVSLLSGCQMEASKLSGETKWSKCLGVELPVETEASIAGVYQGYDGGGKHQARIPRKVTLSADRLANPQLLILSGNEEVIWDISAINPSLVKGVVTYGYSRQQVYGAQPSLPIRHVVYESTFNMAKSDKFCGSYHTVHKGGAELDLLVNDVTQYAGVPVVRFAGGLNPSLLKLDGGIDQGTEFAGDAIPPGVDNLPVSEGLSNLVSEGAVRLATVDEVKAWNQAATTRLKSKYLAPFKSERLGHMPTYIVLKAFTVPDGMNGGYARPFIVPKNVVVPSGGRSHNTYYLMDGGTCIGPDPDCQSRSYK